MAGESFWLIQDLIETPLPKVYRLDYYVLKRERTGRWLDRHKDASMTGLWIEAASVALEIAKTVLVEACSEEAGEVIKICRESLVERRHSSRTVVDNVRRNS